MKKEKLMLAIVLLTVTSIWAQTEKLASFIVPTETDQKLLYYIIEKYQNPTDTNSQLMFFYSPVIEGKVGIVNIPFKDNDNFFGDNLELIDRQEDEKRLIMHQYMEERANVLREIVEYHKAIEAAEQELLKIKKERDLIEKKLNFMKSLLNKKRSKIKINRID